MERGESESLPMLLVDGEKAALAESPGSGGESQCTAKSLCGQ